jgi:hypothetical protein
LSALYHDETHSASSLMDHHQLQTRKRDRDDDDENDFFLDGVHADKVRAIPVESIRSPYFGTNCC